VKVGVLACAVCGPGLPDWNRAADVLAGRTPWNPADVREPTPAPLPPNERRRLPATARVALGVGFEALQAAGVAAAEAATVFTSCGSDGAISHQICDALARPVPEMSPTRFHNSVHNAPGGYWSIAFGSHAPSTSVCAFDGSFAAGLLEAATQASVEQRTVLLVAYDLPYPAPLSALWNVAMPFAVGLALAPPQAGSTIDVALAEDDSSAWPADLPGALRNNPAAASLPLLALLARNAAGRVVLPYHAGCRVAASALRG
jgi:hypothetical protein